MSNKQQKCHCCVEISKSLYSSPVMKLASARCPERVGNFVDKCVDSGDAWQR